MSGEPQGMPVRNPRSGVADYWFVAPTKEELADIYNGLRLGQQSWGRRTVEERAEVMRQWADAIEKNADQIGDAEALDTGRWRLSHDVPHWVVAGVRSWCDRAPQIIEGALFGGTSTIYPTMTFETQLKPYPLVGFITPWNHPFLLSTLDAIPALLAGCAAIIKPSEIAPRFIEPVMETVRSVPEMAKVLRFVPGDGAIGGDIIANVDSLCFTGSVTTGRKVIEACARRFIPSFLELGGKDAVIVTQNADLDRAATAVLRGSVFATGQICFAIERVYVHESVHDEFVRLLAEKSDRLQLTYPDPKRGHIGPFILERQASIVDKHIDDALAKGARLVTGGKSQNLGGGLYMNATVLTEVTHEMQIMREETFGPVTPVMRYSTEREAIALANDSEYGLSAAVIGGDLDEARRIGRELDAGAIGLQDAACTEAILRDAEKTSFNKSGLGGSRMGPNGMLRYFRKKALIANCGATIDMLALGEDGMRERRG